MIARKVGAVFIYEVDNRIVFFRIFNQNREGFRAVPACIFSVLRIAPRSLAAQNRFAVAAQNRHVDGVVSVVSCLYVIVRITNGFSVFYVCNRREVERKVFPLDVRDTSVCVIRSVFLVDFVFICLIAYLFRHIEIIAARLFRFFHQDLRCKNEAKLRPLCFLYEGCHRFIHDYTETQTADDTEL